MTPDPEPPDFSPPPVPVEEAIVTDQLAAHAAEAHGHHAPVHTHCENCGTELQGPFCHRCGQHDMDFHRSFGHAVHDALENFFHFDTKLFRNTVTLLFRPGLLSAEFNAGHRAAQMPPLRFYIFVSILFFFVNFSGPSATEGLVQGKLDPTERSELDAALGQTAARHPDKAAKVEKLKEVPAPPEGAATAPDKSKPKAKEEDSELERTIAEKSLYAMEHQREMAEAFLHAVPKMLLVCLPFFALYTRFLFRKSGQAYLQHLVVALHFHTFIFLWLMIRNGWVWVVSLPSPGLGGLLYFAAGVWMTIYPLLMLRRLYGNSWKLTFFKTLTLALAYLFTISLAFGLTAGIVFLML